MDYFGFLRPKIGISEIEGYMANEGQGASDGEVKRFLGFSVRCLKAKNVIGKQIDRMLANNALLLAGFRAGIEQATEAIKALVGDREAAEKKREAAIRAAGAAYEADMGKVDATERGLQEQVSGLTRRVEAIEERNKKLESLRKFA